MPMAIYPKPLYLEGELLKTDIPGNDVPRVAIKDFSLTAAITHKDSETRANTCSTWDLGRPRQVHQPASVIEMACTPK